MLKFVRFNAQIIPNYQLEKANNFTRSLCEEFISHNLIFKIYYPILHKIDI